MPTFLALEGLPPGDWPAFPAAASLVPLWIPGASGAFLPAGFTLLSVLSTESRFLFSEVCLQRGVCGATFLSGFGSSVPSGV